MADSGQQKKNRDKEMAAHLKRIGYPHGRRWTSPSWPFDVKQVGSNCYVRYLLTQRGKKR